MKKFHDEVVQILLKNVAGIKSRAMFGGYGLYKNSVIFGMIVGDNVYFKVDASNIADYEAANSEPFIYQRASGKPISMSYWKVPEHVLKNEKMLKQWIHNSLKISLKKSTKPLSRAKS